MKDHVEKASVKKHTSPNERPPTLTEPASPEPKNFLTHILSTVNTFEASYSTCVIFIVFVGICISLIPLKEFYLGSYVTKPFDAVHYDVVARKLNHLGVITSGVHYHDIFHRQGIGLIDSETNGGFNRENMSTLTFSSFLVRANVLRADLLNNLPDDMLSLPVDTMNDVYAPICGPTSSFWESPPQLLFGNWFPTIRHEFCRDFHKQFPRDRFFNHNTKAPIDNHLADVGKVTLGLIGVVNMSEVYLRQFTDALVIRKIMKNVQEGFLEMELPEYADTVADAIVQRYRSGIPLSDVIALLPGSTDENHIALVDVLGISVLQKFYLAPHQLTTGVNINIEAAILAEVTHAAASYMTSDFIINTVGMHYVSTVHLAPFWACAIKHTTMAKDITVDDVDAAAIKQCGSDLAPTLPVFIVNLMYLFQSDQRDYTQIDNTTTYTLGRRRESDAEFVPLVVPEILEGSALLSMDGSAWTKERKATPQTLPETPYGYLFTPDCQTFVDTVMQQTGRNVQKYQAYLGDGLGNCAYRDSQETPPQTLCRLFMTTSELLFRSLNGSTRGVPTCSSLLTTGASNSTLALEQENLRQVEWFMIDTTTVDRQVRIQDNTSRQLRTFLLLLNLLGATLYSIHYLLILRNVWIFIRNSVYCPVSLLKSPRLKPAHIGLIELLQCDPADGALAHPATMALLYLGAVGALSNIFSLKCSAQLSRAEGSVIINCLPSIPLSSRSLVFTSLSSSYWVIRILLQTRSLGARLTHAARPDLLRFWVLNFMVVLVIHFICKRGTDLISQNVELHSDPHLYAIVCGFLFTMVISVASLLVPTAATGIKRRKIGLLDPTIEQQANGGNTSDRKFTARWGSGELDSVLHHCATSQIARQLDLLRRHRDGSNSRSQLFIVSRSNGQNTAIHIQEFVIVHCAAGAHAHLQRVRWTAGGGVASVDGPRSINRVFTTELVESSECVQVKHR